jgi:transcription elongation GreA/GreB family factor
MQEDLQQAIESGKLTQQAADGLERLAPGNYCQHKSWGFGKVAEWDLAADQIYIDFGTRKHHPMQPAYAATALQPIPDGHILARRATDPEGVREQAVSDPVGLARAVLSDLGGRATADQVAACFVPGIFDAPAFKKWWDATKKKMKGDGCFQMPIKKNEPFVLLEVPTSPTHGMLERFRAARFLKDQVAALDLITKALDDFASEVEELRVLSSQIEDAAAKGSRLQSAQALELLLARDEILARHEALERGEGAPAVADILRAESSRIAEIFSELPAAKQKRALDQFPEAFGEAWVDHALRLAKVAPARLLADISKLLEKKKRGEEFRIALVRWIGDRSVSAEALIWLCRERGANFPDLFEPSLVTAIFSALERDMLDEKRGSRLHDLLLDDKGLLDELLGTAEPEVVRDIVRRLMLTPVYDDLNKRSLMGRIIKLHPEIQSMIGGGEETTSDETLTVSWASLTRRKQAFEHLVNVEIPQNTKDIAVAREQGDLRENFGFKAAKEQQRVLMRRRAEAERDLGRARGTNFENPDTSQVSIGTIVTVRTGDGQTETYSILGAWDSIPDRGVISYLAGIGQALLGKKVGEEIELAGETGTRRVQILSIVAFTDLALLEANA